MKKPIIELAKFADGRLMLRVRFYKNSNFWFNDGEEATWVPTLDEVDLVSKGVHILDKFNEDNKKEKRELKLSNVLINQKNFR